MRRVTAQQPVGPVSVCISLSLLIKIDQWVRGHQSDSSIVTLPMRNFSLLIILVATDNHHLHTSFRVAKNGGFEYLQFLLHLLPGIFLFNNPAHPKELKARCWKRYLYTHVHSSIISNSQEEEAIQMSTERWMVKQIRSVHTMKCDLASTRKEILTHATMCMNLGDLMLSEVIQTQKDTHWLIPLTGDP